MVVWFIGSIVCGTVDYEMEEIRISYLYFRLTFYKI